MGWLESAISGVSGTISNAASNPFVRAALPMLSTQAGIAANIGKSNAGGIERMAMMGNPALYGSATIAANRAGLNRKDPQSDAIPLAGVGGSEREADLARGMAEGKRLFYDDPDMQDIRKRRQDLAEGYSGQELGASSRTARGEIEGARKGYLQNLAGNIGRAGVGGSRAAAMKSAANVGYQKNIADAERKMLLDSAQMKRQGTGDYQDFLMRQRFGQLGTSMGYGQLGVADRGAAQQAAIANKGT